MKTILSVLAFGVILSGVNVSAETIVARLPRGPRAETVTTETTVDKGENGAVISAVRGGNPAQAVNPRAPHSYGSGERFVSHDNDNPAENPAREGRGVGFRLFSLIF